MPKRKIGLSFWLLVAALILYLNYTYSGKSKEEEITYDKFIQLIRAEKVVSVIIYKDDVIIGVYRSGMDKKKFKTPYLDDPNLIGELQTHGIEYTGKTGNKWFSNIIFNFGPILLFVLLWFLMATKMS